MFSQDFNLIIVINLKKTEISHSLIFFQFQDDENADGKTKLRKWLNMNFRIEMTDGRVLIGVFLCTDRDANVILGKLLDIFKIHLIGLNLLYVCKQIQAKLKANCHLLKSAEFVHFRTNETSTFLLTHMRG